VSTICVSSSPDRTRWFSPTLKPEKINSCDPVAQIRHSCGFLINSVNLHQVAYL
jgi:hypothetical protein